MSSSGNHFYKTTKGKYTNMYQFDGFKPSNLSDTTKPKTSMSPNRLIMKDFGKSAKSNTILPMMNSYNNHHRHKLMDNVFNYFYNFRINYKRN